MGTSNMHGYAKTMKEDLVRKEGITDLASFVVVLTDRRETFFGRPGKFMQEALEAGMRIGDILAGSVEQLRRDHDMIPIRRMMLVVEGYSRSIDVNHPDPESRMPSEHGDLAKDFVDNPDSDVVEVLMTNIWTFEDDEIHYQLWISPFHYTDGGVIVWGETLGPLGDEGTSGAVYESGKAVMR